MQPSIKFGEYIVRDAVETKEKGKILVW
jgi:hypothetical protein